MTFEESMQESKKWTELQDLAEKLFPGRITIGTSSHICHCCGDIHHESTITLKDIKDSERT